MGVLSILARAAAERLPVLINASALEKNETMLSFLRSQGTDGQQIFMELYTFLIVQEQTKLLFLY